MIKDAVWAAAFAANIRFASVGTDYFAKGEPPSPLQHYWSLAVEEQFYLAWPILLVGAIAFAGARGGRLGRRAPLLLIAGLSLASFGWSVYATYESPTTAYFSTLTRAWELGVGAALGVRDVAREGAGAALARRRYRRAGSGGGAARLLLVHPGDAVPGLSGTVTGPRHRCAPVRRGRGRTGAVSRLLGCRRLR